MKFWNIKVQNLDCSYTAKPNGTHQSLKSEKSNPLRALRNNFNNVLLFWEHSEAISASFLRAFAEIASAPWESAFPIGRLRPRHTLAKGKKNKLKP